MDNKRNLAFGKKNYILIAIGMLIVIVGFLLMITPSSTETHFEESIFSVRAIKVAPTVCFFGFLFVIYGIMAKSKKDDAHDDADSLQSKKEEGGRD